MGAPKTLAQANRRLLWLSGYGSIANIHAPTVAELTAAGVYDMSCDVTKADYQLGASGDNAVTDPAACAAGDSGVPGTTTYDASLVFFRRIGPLTSDDRAWRTFTTKGLEGYLAERIGSAGSYTDPVAAGQEWRVYGVVTATPVVLPLPTDGGFEKFRQTFMVQTELVDERAVIAAAVTESLTDNGDGTATYTGPYLTDNGDGTATYTGTRITDNNDGTATYAA